MSDALKGALPFPFRGGYPSGETHSCNTSHQLLILLLESCPCVARLHNFFPTLTTLDLIIFRKLIKLIRDFALGTLNYFQIADGIHPQSRMRGSRESAVPILLSLLG